MENSPGRLLRDARDAAGFSVGELARAAGVPESTVRRIESGSSDPTIGMLDRLLTAAGNRLSIATAQKPRPRSVEMDLRRIARGWKRKGAHPELQSLRQLLDEVMRTPTKAHTVIRARPEPTGSRALDALLAAVAEKIADDHSLRRPAWTKHAPVLARTWSMPGTPSMKARRLEQTPPQLIARGLILDEGSLWRGRESVGA